MQLDYFPVNFKNASPGYSINSFNSVLQRLNKKVFQL